jgi:hypothetical protein
MRIIGKDISGAWSMSKYIILACALLALISALAAEGRLLVGIHAGSVNGGVPPENLNAGVLRLQEQGYGILHYDQDWVIAIAPEALQPCVEAAITLCPFPSDPPLYLITGFSHRDPETLRDLGNLLLESTTFDLLQSSLGASELRLRTGSDVLELPQEPLRLRAKPVLPPLEKGQRTDIAELVAAVDADSVLHRIQSLQDFQTRYALAGNRLLVAQWIRQQFLDFGLADVQLQPFTYGATDQYNVIATLPGSLYPDRYIVVGGHHDSTCRTSSGDPLITAPGADDNGSGATAVMEMARVMLQSGYQPKASIRFITYAAEEQGLRGSDHSAGASFAGDMDIRLMINFDMIANNSHDPSSWQVRLMPYDGSLDHTNYAIQITEQYSSLDAYPDFSWWNSASSDSYPYWRRGYDAIYFFEADFSPYYHSVDDLVSNLDPAYCTEVIRGAVACAAVFADLEDEPAAPAAIPPTNLSPNGFTANWTAVPGASGYRLDVYTKTPGGQATGLFFSEYLEGNLNNKALEIFNGTGSAVDLGDYAVQCYVGAATSPTYTLDLSGSLADGEVLVIAHPNAFPPVLERADLTSTVAAFDGDDQIALYRDSKGDFADIIGRIGTDPGSYWGVSPLITYNKTLARKSTVTAGVAANPPSGFPTLATEWLSFERDSYTGLGSHSLDTVVYVPGYQDLDVGLSTGWPVVGLEPGTQYYYVVRADLGYGSFGASNEMGAATPGDGVLPVELSSFTATASSGSHVSLEWITESETGIMGYYLMRGTQDLFASATVASPFLEAANSSQTHVYSYTDLELPGTGIYHYWLVCVEIGGSTRCFGPVSVYYSQHVEPPGPAIPAATGLGFPLPNPFSSWLSIPYSLARASAVGIRISNSRGQLVREYRLGGKDAGNHHLEWDGRDQAGSSCASGIYQVTLSADERVFHRKVVLLK